MGRLIKAIHKVLLLLPKAWKTAMSSQMITKPSLIGEEF
jgi:hypothetical protein